MTDTRYIQRMRIKEGTPTDALTRHRRLHMAVSLHYIEELAHLEDIGATTFAGIRALQIVLGELKLPPDWYYDGETVTYTIDTTPHPNRLGAIVYLLTVETHYNAEDATA